MHVRRVELHVAGRADRADLLALGDAHTLRDGQSSEMRQGDGISVGGLDRRRPPVSGQPGGEGHEAGGRRDHRRARSRADVGAGMPVLVVLGAAEAESTEDRAFDGPAPSLRHARSGECDEKRR